MSYGKKLRESSSLISVVLLITALLGSIYAATVTTTGAAGVGLMDSFVLAATQLSLTWQNFKDSPMGATRLYRRIALVLAAHFYLRIGRL
jgi:C4-dicarboxylate transporter, DctM subunit